MAFDLGEIQRLVSEGVRILGHRAHNKASEQYLDVEFAYDNTDWTGSVPIEYRRTGVHAYTDEDAAGIVSAAYEAMHPDRAAEWLRDADEYWDGRRAEVTREFFEALKGSTWKCVACDLPENPNWARRVQDIKEAGFTLATDTNRLCAQCNRSTTHLLLLRIPQGGESGYESWSPALRRRILRVLGNRDVYEDRVRTSGLLPDHKFPEIRWDADTRAENPDDMSDGEIRAKFQLLNNQRNQQKREVCRRCFQTNQRGTPFGIDFFYEGGPRWPEDVPKRGADAELGCVGCGWYDMLKWREELNSTL